MFRPRAPAPLTTLYQEHSVNLETFAVCFKQEINKDFEKTKLVLPSIGVLLKHFL